VDPLGCKARSRTAKLLKAEEKITWVRGCLGLRLLRFTGFHREAGVPLGFPPMMPQPKIAPDGHGRTTGERET